MASRRVPALALLACVLVLLAGCTGATPGGSDTATTAPATTDVNETTTTTPATSTPCQPVDVPRSDAVSDTEYPAMPPELNESSAERYALAFEEAFAWHRTYDETQDDMNIDVHDHTRIEETNRGYIVDTATVEISTRTGDAVGSNAWSAHYLVTTSKVTRGQGHAEFINESPPREEWQVVCD